MKSSSVVAVFVGLLLLCGCATAPRQVDRFLAAERDIPDFFQITDVPLLQQSENYCGPATLAMALNWAGVPVSMGEIARQVYTPGKNGTYQNDLISASRRRGTLAIPIYGISALLREVAAGHPVIVFENLGLSWYARWHYALVLGYDLREQKIILHTGNQAYQHWDLHQFERSWILGGYWGLLVLPPSKLAATANELAHAEAAAALEEVQRLDDAKQVYLGMLTKWPDSFSAFIGLGNVAYSKGEFRRSAGILEKAVLKYPDSPVIWHNLATAQAAGKLPIAARHSALRALALATPEQVPGFRQSLEASILGDASPGQQD